MHPQIESLFDDADTHYLKPNELSFIHQFVSSLPNRVDTYRALRDRELEVMQWVADQLQAELPTEPVEHLERSIKTALLILRTCAMGMLLDDDTFVADRLLGWLTGILKAYDTRAIDRILHRLLNQKLTGTLTPKQLELLTPQISRAQAILLEDRAPVAI